MDTDAGALAELIAKDRIRELVGLYSRGCDRQDLDLVRSLYAPGATDSHDVTFDGPADAYVDFLAASLPHVRYSGHHVCNHLISVDAARGVGEGEVYAIAVHIIPDREAPGAFIEDFMCVRYIDSYVRGEDGQWRFARRVVRYDMRAARPYVPHRDAILPGDDPSYAVLTRDLFARGLRR